MPFQVLSKYQFFRTDWHVKLQVVAPAMEYGFLEGYVEPLQILSRQGFYKLKSASTSHENFQLMSPTTGFTLSINEQETMEFDLPWPYPGTFLSLASFSLHSAFEEFMSNEFWRLHLNGHSIRKIQGGSEAPSCSVLVYVSLKDPIFTGPSPGLQPWAPVGGLQAVFRVNEDEPEWIEAQAMVPANPVARAGRYMDMAMGGGAAMLGAFLNEMQGNIVKRGAPAAVEFMAQQMQKKLEIEQQEAEIIPTDPNVGNERSGVKQSVYGNTSAFAGTSSFQNIGDTHNTGIVDPSVCGMPGTIEHDFAHLIRRWTIMSEPTDGNGKNARAFYVLPNYYASYNTQTATTVEPREYGYLAWASTFYRLWRGSLKYKMEVFGSPLIMAKLLINIFWTRESFERTVGAEDWSQFDQNMLEAAGDVYSLIFTVKGRCTLEWEVPFLKPTMWSTTANIDRWTPVMSINFVDIRPSVIDGSVIDIPNYIAVKAGDDFEFCSYTGGKVVLTGTPPSAITAHAPSSSGKEKDDDQEEPERISAHGFINDDSEVMLEGGPVKHTIGGAPVDYQCSPTNFYQLLKRPSVQVANTYPPFPGRYPDMNSISEATRQEAYVLSRPMDKIAMCFLWWRGSMNHKMVFDAESQGGGEFTADLLRCGVSNPNSSSLFNATAETNMTTDYGAQLTETDIWPVIEVEFPYINTFNCTRTSQRSTGQGPGFNLLFSDPYVGMLAQRGDDESSVLPKQTISSIGQDFRFYGLIPPPNLLAFEIKGTKVYPSPLLRRR